LPITIWSALSNDCIFEAWFIRELKPGKDTTTRKPNLKYRL
jgi:hypothetical protein